MKRKLCVIRKMETMTSSVRVIKAIIVYLTLSARSLVSNVWIGRGPMLLALSNLQGQNAHILLTVGMTSTIMAPCTRACATAFMGQSAQQTKIAITTEGSDVQSGRTPGDGQTRYVSTMINARAR